MGEPLAICIAQVIFSGILVASACGLAWRLTPEHDRPEDRRRLVDWSLKGLLLPFVVWAVMNLAYPGICSPSCPPSNSPGTRAASGSLSIVSSWPAGCSSSVPIGLP